MHERSKELHSCAVIDGHRKQKQCTIWCTRVQLLYVLTPSVHCAVGDMWDVSLYK